MGDSVALDGLICESERERERRFVISFSSSTVSVSIFKIRSHDENVMTCITACDHLPPGFRVTMFR